MKTGAKNLALLLVLAAGLGLGPADPVTAQTFAILHSFTGANDGASPYARLMLSDNTLYGTTYGGGSAGLGTVFRMNLDGSCFTNLHNFTGGSDGYGPYAGLVLSGDTLYGTAPYGGNAGHGIVYRVKTNGSGFTNLYTFTLTSGIDGTNGDGVHPFDELFLSGNTLYGTAASGGLAGWGTVFGLNTNGTGFTNLHNFTFASNDGNYPYIGGGLVLSGNTLYGTTVFGGTASGGNVFKVNTDGTGYTNLYSFTNGTDGASPNSGLVLLGNTLYGTAVFGGSAGVGTVFAINTDGTGFRTVHGFAGHNGGGYPFAGLALSGGTLYGTANLGGDSGWGTVFAIHTDGTGFRNLYSFTGGNDGDIPYAGLILSGNTLYGTTSAAGSSNYGTVFGIALPVPPQLAVIRSGTNVVLTWPANAGTFTLQSTTNLASPAGWTTVSPDPAASDGQNAVTNPASGAWKFYRLSQ